MLIWKPLVGESLKCMKEPTKELDKNAASVVFTNSHYKEEVVDHVQGVFWISKICRTDIR